MNSSSTLLSERTPMGISNNCGRTEQKVTSVVKNSTIPTEVGATMFVNSQSTLRIILREKFSNLIFRRVGQVDTSKKFDVKYISSDGSIKFSEVMIELLTSEIKEKHLQYEYESFSGETTTKIIRDNDFLCNASIKFSSDTYSELDIENATFEFKKTGTKIAPRIQRHINGRIIYSDLICGIVEVDEKTNVYRYKNWFICSDQFLRMWTAIQYDNHKIFHTSNFVRSASCHEEFEEKLYTRLMSGNRLCTNAFRKWGLTLCEHNTELENLFHVSRTEKESIKWCHIYAAIVLIVRYGILPDNDPKYHNIPSISDGEGIRPMSYEWDIPKDFVNNLLSLK